VLALVCATLSVGGGAADASAQATPRSVETLSTVFRPSPAVPRARCARRRSNRFLRQVRRRCNTQPGGRRRRIGSTPYPLPPARTTPVAPPATATQNCVGAELTPAAGNLDQVRGATLCLINNERVRAGLRALSPNGTLQGVAQHKSEDMVARDYFDHTSPTGETAADRVLNSGYVPEGASYAIGENIAFGTMNLGTPSSIVEAWMHSPGHRANILDAAYRETGIGVAPAAPPSFGQGQPGGTYTQEFGSHG
jgi:uncharacterized protein YkwD